MRNTLTKRIISVLLAACLSSSAIPISFAADHSDRLVDVVLYQDDNQIITASVYESDKAAYEQRLSNDPVFKQEQIDSVLSSLRPGTRALPEGNILSQQTLKRADLKRMVDAASGHGTFDGLVNGASITSGLVTIIIKASRFASGAALAAGVFGTILSYMTAKQETWWRDSYQAILEGSITGVRYTIIENVKSEYPKAWRVLEQV